LEYFFVLGIVGFDSSIMLMPVLVIVFGPAAPRRFSPTGS
jgi:hypothetical protein